jgi:hypothetical protein
LLRLNELLDTDDIGTRDVGSINGSLNSVKDLLTSFNMNLVPNRILFINDFG